jgi:hypothetical protein
VEKLDKQCKMATPPPAMHLISISLLSLTQTLASSVTVNPRIQYDLPQKILGTTFV